jgi:polyhydroxyalkanoate synthase
MEGPGGLSTSGGSSRANALVEAALEGQQRIFKRWLAIPRVFEAALGTRVGTTPHEIVLREGTHTLLRYTRETAATQAEPVLLCYALVNRPYILDLEPDRSVVRQYLDRGFDVYLIDWGAPSPADRGLTLEHYVCGFLAKAVDHVRRAHARPNVHLLGYCMGGTMAAAYAALEPDALRTLTLLAAPIDFGGRRTLLEAWTGARTFDVDAIVDTYGNCPAWFLQTCFLWMNPIRNFVEKPIAFYEQLDDPRAVSSFFALERWLNDNIPVAGETFREFVKRLCQRNELVRGELTLGGRRVDLARIACPLLLLTAKKDHLIAPEATEAIRSRVGSRDVTSLGIPAGHVGLVVGARAHATLWPEVTAWAATRSTPARAATSPSPDESCEESPAGLAVPPRAPPVDQQPSAT